MTKKMLLTLAALPLLAGVNVSRADSGLLWWMRCRLSTPRVLPMGVHPAIRI